MEAWQINHLIKNRPDLLKVTICNEALLARLLSDGILAGVDVDMIKSKPAGYHKISTLYDIVTTRKNGFVAMAKALADSRQSGACEIFTDGFAHHFTKPEINIDFLENVKPLSAYLDRNELNDVMKIMKESLSREQLVDFYEKSQSSNMIIKLVDQTIPNDPPFYIPRTLFKRLVVNKKIFQATCSDIFLFKDIRLFNLTELVKPQRVASSSGQLHRISSRFILLEDEEDWDDIREIAQAPLHLIKYEAEINICILERTTGGSRVIHDNLEKCVSSEKAEELSSLINEDTFVETVPNDKSSGACICDSPGMGKSLLLTKLARKTAKRFPNKLVVFTQLSKFIQHLFSVENVPEVNAQFSRATLLNFLSLSPLAAIILAKILTKGNIHMELFLDGFDEVQHEHIEFTKKLLSEMAFSFHNTRVYVTSRPHLRHELEKSLQVISYDILPFTRENQIDFLVDSWTSKARKPCQKKASEFAGHLLKMLSESMSAKELNITGIPLTCRLLAEVYFRDAQMYSRPARTLVLEDCCQFKSSLPELYKMFIEHAFNKLKNQPEDVTLSVKGYHVWIAICTIFPEIVDISFNEFESNTSHPVTDLCSSTGLLNSKCLGGIDSHEFIHRTFAEYFVSEFLANILKNAKGLPLQELQKRLTNPLFGSVLKTEQVEDLEYTYCDQIFVYPTVVYFFNHFTSGMSIPSKDHIIPNTFLATVPPKNLHLLLVGCLRERYGDILNMIHSILLVMDRNVKELYKLELIPATGYTEPEKLYNLITVTAKLSNVCLATQLFLFFQQCFDSDLNRVCQDMSCDWTTPLHYAVRRLDFELVQFFARNIVLENRELLQLCWMPNNENDLQVVSKKTEIFEFLLTQNETLENRPCPGYDVHVEMLKLLFRLGVNTRRTKKRKTVVHRAAKYMTPSHFHELTRFLIDECNRCQLFLRNESEWKWPLNFILSKQKAIETRTLEMMLAIPGVSVKEVDNMENTLFHSAVKARQRVEILERLIEFGVDSRAVNRYGQGALHLAAENADLLAIQLLLERGLDPYQVDMAGNSFLHYFAWNPISSEQYNQVINVIVSARHTAIFHVRNVLDQLPIHVAIRDVDVDKNTLKLLQEHGVDFNSTDKDNWSLLMYAALGRRSVNLLQTLIKMGVDTTIQDRDGNTFAHCLFKNNAVDFNYELENLIVSNRGMRHAWIKGQDECNEYFVSREFEIQDKFDSITELRRSYGNIIQVHFTENCHISASSDFCAEKTRSRQFLRILKEINVDVADKELLESPQLMTEYYSFKDYHSIVDMLNEIDGGSKLLASVNNFGETPLHFAVLDKNLDVELLNRILEKLVDRNVLKISSTGGVETETMLINAANEKQRFSFLKRLIQCGTNVIIQDEDGNTFAHHCSKYCTAEEYDEVMRLLLDNGHVQVFRKVNNNGESPLHLAVRHVELSESTLNLIKCQLIEICLFDVNSADEYGQTLLMCAVQGKRSVAFLRTLMEMGADVTAQDNKGNTIAHWMSKCCSAEEYHDIVKIFFEKGREMILMVTDILGMTAFHWAVYFLELLPETLEYFFVKETTVYQGRSNLSMVSASGESVLHFAVMGGRSLQFVQHLVKLGADWSVTSNHKSNLAHCSASFGFIDHLKYFVELGCNINDVDNDGDNVLQCAIQDAPESDHIAEMVEFLVEKGANKHNTNKEGKTAYMCALEKDITDKRILNALQ